MVAQNDAMNDDITIRNQNKGVYKKRDYTQMEIVFGRPSKDCRDIVICRINLLSDVHLNSVPTTSCTGRIKANGFISINDREQIIICFPKQQLVANILKKQFANNQFIINEPYDLPEKLQELLSPRKQIKKGSYKVREIRKMLVLKL